MEEQTEQNKIIGGKIVKTYAEDMAEAIDTDKGALLKKFIHSEEIKAEEKRSMSPEAKKGKFFMFAGSFFLVFSLIVLGFTLLNKQEVAIVEIEAPVESLVWNDGMNSLDVADLTRDQIVALIIAETNATKVKPGGIEAIFFTIDKKIIGLRKFFSLLKTSLFLPAPEFVDDNFMFGSLNRAATPGEPSGRDLFILLQMHAIADIFPNLHNWEGKMVSELGEIFGIDITPANNYLLTKSFQDSVIENKNARVLYREDGGIALMYVYIDTTHVLITKDPNIVQEVIARLAASQVKK